MKSTRKTYVKTDDGFSLANKVFIKHGADTVAVSSIRVVDGNWDIKGVPAPEIQSSLAAIVQQPSADNDYYAIAKLINPNPPPSEDFVVVFLENVIAVFKTFKLFPSVSFRVPRRYLRV